MEAQPLVTQAGVLLVDPLSAHDSGVWLTKPLNPPGLNASSATGPVTGWATVGMPAVTSLPLWQAA